MTSRKLPQRDRSCPVHFFWGKGDSTLEAVQQLAVYQAGSSLPSLALALPTAAAQEAWDGLTQFPGSLLSSRPDLHNAFVKQVLISSPAHPDSSRQMCVTGLLYVPDIPDNLGNSGAGDGGSL